MRVNAKQSIPEIVENNGRGWEKNNLLLRHFKYYIHNLYNSNCAAIKTRGFFNVSLLHNSLKSTHLIYFSVILHEYSIILTQMTQ